MAVEEWECVSSEIVGDHDVFKVRRSIMRSPRTGDEHEFHMLDVPLCVKVIPVTEDGHIVLVEQYRQAVQRASLEFPAGVMEPGEDAITAGMRELEEETGYRAKRATVIGEFDPDPAIQANAIKLVIAHGCTPEGRKNQDEGEDVQVRVVTPEEVGRLIRNGTIRHAAAISAWYLYESMNGSN
jgi:ADP-ribose pyrophosphatase